MLPERLGEAVRRVVDVSFIDLEFAFTSARFDVRHYLDLGTGEIVAVEVPSGSSKPSLHERGVAAAWISPVSPREQFDWMARFVEELEAGPLKDELTDILQGISPFRRFKRRARQDAVLYARWLAYRTEKLRSRIDAWARESGFAVTTSRTARPSAGWAARNPIALDRIRSRLSSLAEELDERDLAAACALAEYLMHRQTAESAVDADDEIDHEPLERAG